MNKTCMCYKKKKKNEQDIISTSFSPPLLFSFVPTSKAKLLSSFCCYNTRKIERAMDVHDLSEEAKRGLHMYEESSDDLVVDFRGRPCRQDKHGGTRAALFVLGILLYVYPRIDHSMLRMVGSVHVKHFEAMLS